MKTVPSPFLRNAGGNNSVHLAEGRGSIFSGGLGTVGMYSNIIGVSHYLNRKCYDIMCNTTCMDICNEMTC